MMDYGDDDKDDDLIPDRRFKEMLGYPAAFENRRRGGQHRKLGR